MGEAVTRATLKKRSSIQVGLEKVRDGEADAFFSAGNTAACWTIAKMVLGHPRGGRSPRPGRGGARTSRGCTVLLDVGANATARPATSRSSRSWATSTRAAVFQVAEPARRAS